MQLTMTLQPQEGFLGGPHDTCFSVTINNKVFDISINQIGKRDITISSENCSSEEAFSVYYALDTLLMLFDGQFYPVVEVFDGTDTTDDWKKQILPSHTSADFMITTANKLLDFDTALNTSVFQKWLELSNKLDLVHKMVLYCLSAVQMPKDIQCAYMIEAFKGLCDLIHDQKPTFAESLYNGKEPNLKAAFLAVCNQYGADVFSEEKSRSIDRFAQILIDSRNRIAHIKHKKNKQILNGEECVWYVVKLSLLYRVVLFDLLGIPCNLYEQRLKNYLQEVNKQDAIRKLVNSLSNKRVAPEDPKLEQDIYDLLYTFVYSMAIYRSLYTYIMGNKGLGDNQKHFWYAVSDNCLQQAVVDWCKVFGPWDERTHYSKVHASFINDFDKALSDEGINLMEYSKRMKNFRDTFISHRDKLERRKQIPQLDTALKICAVYEEKVLCGEPNRIPFGLMGFYNSSIAKIMEYLNDIILKN